ncbi:MAG TPA: 2-oxo acid dehydrogenase subunit E2 [Candidatus Paceibacterota bacterium]|nr:2-oxo acid dehydrogenase subunit E2 [Verrucomicrobiota bacterium]HSA12014.1 2-oxo acid dehydrogenase subunit E2 [Candidatus Paceibacterota bacterium]
MDLKLPPLGEGADSGTVVSLFVKEGDTLAKDQPILELENEKAVATIPSTAAGTVAEVFVKAGEKIRVGQRILSLRESGQASAGPVAVAESAPRKSRERLIQTPSPEQVPTAAEEEFPELSAEAKPGGTPAAAPSLRKLARDLGIDLSRVRGSARGGRILLEDVRAYIQRLQRLAVAPRGTSAAAPSKPPAQQIDFSQWGPISRQPLSPLRAVIARRMAESWDTTPRVTQFDEADITALMALRKKYAAAYEQKGARLTLTSFALKVVVDTLKKHPIFNASLDEVAQEIVIKNYYHLGLAVDTEAGLIVPVIRDADKKGLLALSLELEELAGKARARKLSAEELKGGTFTISNQGGIGGAHFTPIVNKPEVAILGLGRGAMKAVVREDRIEPRLMLPIGLSYDHRVIDGGAAARFTVDLVQAFENFREEDVKI